MSLISFDFFVSSAYDPVVCFTRAVTWRSTTCPGNCGKDIMHVRQVLCHAGNTTHVPNLTKALMTKTTKQLKDLATVLSGAHNVNNAAN